jgi:hypothetical protein
MGEKRKVYRLLVRKPRGKGPLGRPRGRMVDKIKMCRREIGWSGVDWTGLVQDKDKWTALVTVVLNFWVL